MGFLANTRTRAKARRHPLAAGSRGDILPSRITLLITKSRSVEGVLAWLRISGDRWSSRASHRSLSARSSALPASGNGSFLGATIVLNAEWATREDYRPALAG
jgi:hypothetical protein